MERELYACRGRCSVEMEVRWWALLYARAKYLWVCNLEMPLLCALPKPEWREGRMEGSGWKGWMDREVTLDTCCLVVLALRLAVCWFWGERRHMCAHRCFHAPIMSGNYQSKQPRLVVATCAVRMDPPNLLLNAGASLNLCICESVHLWACLTSAGVVAPLWDVEVAVK